MYSSASLRVKSLALLIAVVIGVIGSGFAIADGAPLDNVGAIRAAAYSLRQLDSDYTGPAIMVRRDSDNTTSDIGFTASGDLDTDTLSAFCGLNSCFVTTWYDQSGNEKNATQITPSMQPRIVSGGELEMSGGHPTLYFFGGQSLSANWGSGYTSYGHSAVYSRDNITWPFGSVYHQGPGWSPGWIHAIEGNGPFNFGLNSENFIKTGGPGNVGGDGLNSTNTIAIGTVGVYTMNAPIGNIALYLNNVLEVSATRTGLAPIVNNVRIGSWDDGQTRYAYYYLSEMVFYSEALTDTDREAFAVNEQVYYGLVSAPSAPTALAGTAATTTVGLSWTAPVSGYPVTDYQIDYRLSTATGWTTFADGVGSGTTATLSGLTDSTSYDITVRAISLAGTGTMSGSITVVTLDGTAPVVTLVGSGVMSIVRGSVFSDSGATWSDAVDGTGTLSVASSGSVNTATAGIYTLTYTKADTAGNTGSTTRMVTVLVPVIVQSSGGGGGSYSAPATIVTPSTTQSGSVGASPIMTASNPAITQDHFDKKAADFKKSKTLTTTTTLKKGTQVIVYRVLPSGKQVKVGTVQVFNGKITYIAKTPGKYILTQK